MCECVGSYETVFNVPGVTTFFYCKDGVFLLLYISLYELKVPADFLSFFIAFVMSKHPFWSNI